MSFAWWRHCIAWLTNKFFSFLSPGQVLAEEWCVGVRRHALGDPNDGTGAAIRPAQRRASDRELRPLLSQRRARDVFESTSELSQGDLWSDAGVLE